jgi:membrane protein implicated in regulation of membrane protease activity
MDTLFLLCIGVGLVALVLQIALAFLGLDHDASHVHVGGDGLEGGLDLLSVRSLAAASAVFGTVGLWLSGPLPAWVAALLALPAAGLAAAATARLTGFMVGMQSDGSLRLEGAVGATGEVYLTVPAVGEGTGLVQFPLQGRSVEMRALTREGEALPTGSTVMVISVDTETETVEVVSISSIQGL